MKIGKRYSPSKALVPMVTLLLITFTILFSLKFFISGRMELSDRRNALILATNRMSALNYQVDVPEDGSSMYHEIVGNSDFVVRTVVFTLAENEREFSVEVTSSSGERIELVRRIYLNCRNGNEIEIESINETGGNDDR
ncbi:MAG: hypothetical protein K8R76_10955 [Candidatus Aegiribacteria sp.]|nr:hypothetical protein [Candidatus Aegiribacteria sp.]